MLKIIENFEVFCMGDNLFNSEQLIDSLKCVSVINMIKSKIVYKNDICCNWSMWKWKV